MANSDRLRQRHGDTWQFAGANDIIDTDSHQSP